jgi:hypothetical protein
MRPIYLFPFHGSVLSLEKDSSTGLVRFNNSYFKPEDLIRQLREAADYLEKYAAKDRSVAKAR